MLCPKCKRDGQDVKMRCIASMPEGSFTQNRKYKCPECDNVEYTGERLRVYGWVEKTIDIES